MLMTSIFIESEYESGIGNPTNLTISSKNDEQCTFPRRPFIPLRVPQVTSFLSTQAQPYYFEHWPRFHQGKQLAYSLHSSGICHPLSYVHKKYTINRLHSKSYSDSLETQFF